ncbi:MAG: tyrosine-type recombinase/integrase [Clostridiales bacterium]|nr:tyrosine-type recombinase/integrase [Clostridiales bacterium]
MSYHTQVEQQQVHDLRHSHATLLIDMNFLLLVISKRLGHEIIETTLQTYSHLYPTNMVKLPIDCKKSILITSDLNNQLKKKNKLYHIIKTLQSLNLQGLQSFYPLFPLDTD